MPAGPALNPRRKNMERSPARHSFPAWEASRWQDYTQDPIIYPDEEVPVIGDPQVILPGEFDGQWHMFYIGRGFFFHALSADGLAWKTASRVHWGCGPTCVT